jgi:hypothetical protein
MVGYSVTGIDPTSKCRLRLFVSAHRCQLAKNLSLRSSHPEISCVRLLKYISRFKIRT